MSACQVYRVRHRMDRPVPCGETATGFRYHEASETWTPACDEHRTHDLEMVRLKG